MKDWDWVPWLLVSIGWFVVNDQNNRRETRKELRAALDDLGEKIDESFDCAKQYWCGAVDQDDASRSDQVKQHLEDVERRLNRFVRRTESEWPFYAWRRKDAVSAANSRALSSFDKWASVTTGGDFEGSSRAPSPANDERLASIRLAGHNLVDQLERTYDAHCQGLKDQ